ncbi:uncharacterized protein LOC100366599 [Saccoglossus kowalevskii]|uniref:Uncharacterized protein LOC100366599 n=1 Tax=Saccoglossus kowalevskii TaxID=10224 RepID=A0ABM0GNL1_SACKO|nr:PREDICTED: uncharacterized protein LOC100366599 [Saccoglossus kowalevskii]
MGLLDRTKDSAVSGSQLSHHEGAVLKTSVTNRKLGELPANMESDRLLEECNTLRQMVGSTKASFVTNRHTEQSLPSDFPAGDELPIPFRLIRGRGEDDVLLQHRGDLHVFLTYLAALEEEEKRHSQSTKPNYARHFKDQGRTTRRVIRKLEGRLSQFEWQPDNHDGTSGSTLASRRLSESNDPDVRSLYIQTRFHDYMLACCRNVESFCKQ